MSNIIKFYKGEETGIVHESYAGADISLFKDQYLMALNGIGAYLSANSSEINNVFAFIGDRGTGKTSCMESVAEMLESHQYDNNRENIISEDLKNILKNKSYCVLKTLDPSIFDEKSNILEIVVGEMFKDFDDIFKRIDIKGSEEDRKKAVNIFQKITRCLKYMSSDSLLSGNGDDIAQLGDMSLVSDLQEHFKDLVESYLKVFNKDILVIKIDDIDMQVKQAPKMVEQLRKYFIQKNVLVLMAVNLEQLQSVIELGYTEDFKAMIDAKHMSAKYLLKFIPIGHRIYMPTFEVYANSLIEYLSNHEQGQKSLIGNGSPVSVKYAVTTLIYEKCRFLFYHSKGVVSPIVPRNLRELRFLLAMLVNMKDYYYAGKDSDVVVQKSNKEQFLNYFNNTWVNNNISAENLSIINAIRGTKDVSSINKVVLSELKIRYGDILTDEFKEILNEKNSSFNISIADVYTILDYIRVRKNGFEDKLLLFFIQTFYSMKLYEYYDELTYNADNGLPPFDIPSNKNEDEDNEFDKYDYTDESIRKIEVVDGLSSYEQLVGGLFVNTDIYHFMPKGSDKKSIQDKLLVNLKTLKDEAKKLVEEDDETKIDSIKLQLIEFVSLCVYRLVDGTPGSRGNIDYRMSSGIVYGFNSKREYNSAEFNIGSFFFNIVNIKGAYDRVHPGLFKLAYDHKDKSLYGKLLSDSEIDRGDWCNTPTHALLSRAAIRNFEVLDDLIVKTQYNWELRSKGSLSANLKYVFNRISKYKIKTYDRLPNKNNDVEKENIKGKEKGMPLVISFDYAEDVANIFRKYEKWENGEKDQFLMQLFSNASQGFDANMVIKSFVGSEYVTSSFRKQIREQVPILRENKQLNKYMIDLVRKYAIGDKVAKKDIETIVKELKQKYDEEVAPLQ